MSNLSDNIKHIVFLMLENRSFDNLLTWCYDGVGEPPVNNIPPEPGTKFFGLSGLQWIFNQPSSWGESHRIVRGVQGSYVPNETPYYDPQESFNPVTQQLFGPGPVNFTDPPGMHGFLQNFYDAWGEKGGSSTTS